ncbi:pyridoxal phosphate-dependent aminotransferase [Petroclostridium sp. X23]|uniref:pyridoxal phosphate-dependent aminotransferase n=1 Tax=Petroclostridium sp. X23 TaxID=3045146 RepID=UPI0024AD77B9|nr:pyridoxal phosphate-dependent aminotransferase [Petroclostridium sp. X23]WHH58862.1 pyridoxal phosphate-dependent aminotransferase [Petroclostridium sp. X23]
MNGDLSKKHKAISSSVTLAIDAKAKKMKADGENIINFGAGEPDFKTPLNIRKAAIKAIEDGMTGYTAASGLQNLKEAICEKLKNDNLLEYTPENIVVSNGAKHSLHNALLAICNPGDEVIVPLPYWVSYPELVKLADAVPVFVETQEKDDFKYKKESIASAITPKTKAIILNSPNNPTGTVYSEEDLKQIAEIAVQHNIYIIADEIYEKLVYEGKHISIASLGDKIKDLTVVVNGMSKCYAMTGWRIGYAAANKEIAAMMANIQSHATSNPNTIAQYASIEALKGDQAVIADMVNAFSERKEYMVKKINSIRHLSCRMPRGAFYVMVNISQVIGKKLNGVTIKNSMDLAEYLLSSAKVAVIPGSGFGTDEFIRLSYATSMDNIKDGLDRIQKALI